MYYMYMYMLVEYKYLYTHTNIMSSYTFDGRVKLIYYYYITLQRAQLLHKYTGNTSNINIPVIPVILWTVTTSLNEHTQ